jgi:hypothetical protein
MARNRTDVRLLYVERECINAPTELFVFCMKYCCRLLDLNSDMMNYYGVVRDCVFPVEVFALPV